MIKIKFLIFITGYWYRLLNQDSTFGNFYNNSVHSVGAYGLWIFPSYAPLTFNAAFDTFVSYLNDKGAEWVSTNRVQFKNFVVYDHATSGIETKAITYNQNINTPFLKYFYDEFNGPSIVNSTIIGNSDSYSNTSITPIGLAIAWDRGELIKNIKFINFPDDKSTAIARSTDGTCT